MSRKSCLVALFLGFCLQSPLAGFQNPAAPAKKPAAEAKKDPLAGFRWLDAYGEAHGSKFDNRQLSSLRADIYTQTPSDTETDVTRPDANSMRATRRIYARGTNGERVLVEVVVEDVRATGAEALSATKTRSQRDVNGNMQVTMRQMQESVPVGSESYRTKTTIMTQGINGALSASEEIVQVEKKNADGAVEIDRTQQVLNSNRAWTTANRRVSITREENGQLLSEENVYRRDANGQLALSQKEISRERQDAQGKTVQEREVSLPNPSGRFELNERLTIVRETYADGSRQTLQSRLQKSTTAPSEGLRLVESISQTDTPAGPNVTERVTAVQTPDPNGRLQTVAYSKAVEKK